MITAQPSNSHTIYVASDSIENHWEMMISLLSVRHPGLGIGRGKYTRPEPSTVDKRRAQWRQYRERNKLALNTKARENMRKLRASRKANA